MNINRDLVARALNKAGEEPLTDEEWKNKDGTRWRVISDFYLATILEALSYTEWTSQKKREQLVLSENANLSTYNFMYYLPIDCAKPVNLEGNGEYLVEDGILYTNEENAILVYVSDGFTNKFVYEEVNPQPTEETFTEGEYYIYNEETEEYERAESYQVGVTYYVNIPQDYEYYSDIKLDPMLSEYIETRLAGKIALKLTGDMQKYQMLFNEAQLIENRAIKATVAHGHNKDTGNPWWAQTLGLSDGED